VRSCVAVRWWEDARALAGTACKRVGGYLAYVAAGGVRQHTTQISRRLRAGVHKRHHIRWRIGRPAVYRCRGGGGGVGFAQVFALGQSGTTGGAGGPTVEVDTATEFIGAIATTGPLNICVRGMLALPAPMNDVAGVNVQMFSHHVWIDTTTCRMVRRDGGHQARLQLRHGVLEPHPQPHQEHAARPRRRQRRPGCRPPQGDLPPQLVRPDPQRKPRVRFGEPVHVFNNYYLHNADVGVACQANAAAWSNRTTSKTSRSRLPTTTFTGTEPGQPDCSGTVQEARDYYACTPDRAGDVKAIVTAEAGVGKIG
jgi:pectate lyase